MDKQLEKAIELLGEFYPTAIYLFGSASRNELRKDSDIDLAFLTNNDIDEYECFIKAQELAEVFNRDVDLIDLAKASAVFRAQIVGNGKLVFCSDEEQRMLFEMRVLKEYALLNDERAEILKGIEERGSIYGKGCNL